MGERLKQSRSHDRVTLREALDLSAAAPLAASLVAMRGDNLTIDASNVQKVGAQCLQVLVSACLTWERDGSSMTLANPSAAFLDALAIAGVDIDRFVERENAQ